MGGFCIELPGDIKSKEKINEKILCFMKKWII